MFLQNFLLKSVCANVVHHKQEQFRILEYRAVRFHVRFIRSLNSQMAKNLRNSSNGIKFANEHSWLDIEAAVFYISYVQKCTKRWYFD